LFSLEQRRLRGDLAEVYKIEEYKSSKLEGTFPLSRGVNNQGDRFKVRGRRLRVE